MAQPNGTATQNTDGSHYTGRKRISVKEEIVNNSNLFTNNNNTKDQVDKEGWKLHTPARLPKDCVSKFMRRPGILTGYRPADQPWNYYLRSTFWIHNETGNVWTHLLGSVIIIRLVFSFNLDFSTDTSAHGLLVFAFTSTFCFICSVSAHLFHNKSDLIHYVLFSFDYIGIALYGYGYGIMLYYCSGNELFYNTMGHFFPIVHAFLATNITLSSIIGRIRYGNR